MTLTLTNRRLPLSTAIALDSGEKAQLTAVLASEDAGTIARARKDEEWASLELVDVLREGQLAYRLVLYPFGSGVLYEGNSTKILFDVVQHGIELHEGTPLTLVTELEAAFARDGKKLGIRESIDFDAPNEKAKPLGPEQILSVTEPKIASRQKLTDDEERAVFVALQGEVSAIDGALTAARLTPLGRRLATVMAKGSRFMIQHLGTMGLPGEPRALEVWLGLVQATGLQQTIAVSGKEQSILEHARAVVKGKLDGDGLIEAIAALGQEEAVGVLDGLLRFDPKERITSFPWEVTETTAARWLVKLVNRLGDAAVTKVGELLLLEGSGTVPRIYVWSQVTPNIAATPAQVAEELTHLKDAWNGPELLSEILPKLPDGKSILPGLSVATTGGSTKRGPASKASEERAPAKKAATKKAPTKKAPTKKAPTKKRR
jgi:hypothetical protein